MSLNMTNSQGILVAAAAFSNEGWLSHLVQPGVASLYEPTDFLYRDSEALEAFAHFIADRRIPIFLPRIPAESPTVQAVIRSHRGKGWVRLVNRGGCPYLPLDEHWSDPERRVSSTLRSDLRRARRKARRFGVPHFEVHAPRTAEAFRPLFDLALEVEDQGWKGTSATSLLRDPVRYPFFEEYCQRSAEAGELRILFLRLGDNVAAMQIAVEYDERLWLLKIGHRSCFDHCSPGMLLIGHSIGYAAQAGLKSYEFLGDGDQWTRRWTRQERPMVSIRTFPYSPRGFLLAAKCAIKRLHRLSEEKNFGDVGDL